MSHIKMEESSATSSSSVMDETGLQDRPVAIQQAANHLELPDDALADGDAEDSDNDQSLDTGVKRWTVNEPARPRKVTAKKLADTAAFDQYIEENRERFGKAVGTDITDLDNRSAAWLVRNFEAKKIIGNPRDYQTELFEKAKEENTIAVLDTGSGKTLIAVLLLRWTVEQELERRAAGGTRKVAFFLVDKVALVFQQHAVLACNLDYEVAKFHGDNVVGRMTEEFWRTTLDSNKIIVLTAEILAQCLYHSYIRMEEINLLIFDEAHHTKKNHPYARIIKDHYFSVDKGDRPRILGMTASPVDSRDDPQRAAEVLESLLSSRIATTADASTLQQTICKPKLEREEEYAMLPDPYDTPLQKTLKNLLKSHHQFQKSLRWATKATSELGPWIADRFWQLKLDEHRLPKIEANAERDLQGYLCSYGKLEERIQQLRDAVGLVKSRPLPEAQPHPMLLSSKVLKLWQILTEAFQGEAGSQRRAIVFVEERNAVTMLMDLFRQPNMQIPGLKLGYLMGVATRGTATNDRLQTDNSFLEQMKTMVGFRDGQLNCILATSVAEEGLDIPDCNFIVRFDLCQTLIQYIQSRGRARMRDSEYVHMMEMYNTDHRRVVDECRAQETTLRKFCEAMPEDRKLRGFNYDEEFFLQAEKGQRRYKVLSTGATLNYRQSLGCLHGFIASLPHVANTSLVASFAIAPVEGGFQCEVTLPDESPIKSTLGRVHTRKAIAKCSAAFEMCVQLHKQGLLDDNLRPIFEKQLPAMRSARLAISSKKKGEYKRRIKPEVWSITGEPETLHVMVLALSRPDALARKSMPLLLLTREPLVSIPSFRLFFGQDVSSEVICIPLPGTLTGDQLDLVPQATKFTLKLFKDVFSKEYEASSADLPYFLAPANKGHDFDFSTVDDLAQLVDWQALESVQSHDYLDCDYDAPDDFWEGKYIVDPYDGSRKFFLRRRRPGMKATDEVPEGVAAANHRAWKLAADKNIVNYSNGMWVNARKKWVLQENQPVFEAELIPLRRNLLDDDVDEGTLRPRQCFIILQPLKISPLPTSTVVMAYNFPAIVHRIESSLIAQDACNLLGLTIRPDLALEALTKDSDNSGEQDAEQLNFQAGMGNNYERLEFLGDCFLKMATTIAIYSHFPDKDEFLYHVERMLLICNRNLFNNALEVNLQEYIRSMSFDRRSWYPAGLKLLRGKVTCPREKHTLGYKSIADVCEALIGAAYLSTFEQNDMDMAVRAVSVMVKDKMHDYTAWSQYRERWTKPAWVTAEATAVDVDMARKFAQRLGYSFRHPRLLRCAFMHPSSNSQLYYKLPSYQQLEFLGDALFDMVCVDFLFHRFPGADPQWLTEHKMAMVSNQFLACLAVELGFHRCIVVCLSQLQKKIRDYVDVMEVARSDAKQAAVAAGKPETEYARHYWCEDTSSGTASGALAGVSAPKCLPDVVEAYIGALFLDSGCDLAVVRDFFRRHVQPFFEDMHIYDTYANNHPVTFLANLMGTRLHCNDWRLINREIPADGKAAAPTAARSEDGDRGDAAADETAAERLHEDGLAAIIKGTRVVSGLMVHGTPWHVVSADSIRYAKVRAAKRALKEMDGLDPAAFRAKYKCNCPLPEEDAKATEACDDAGADEDPAAATGGQGDSHPGSRGGEELVVEVS